MRKLIIVLLASVVLFSSCVRGDYIEPIDYTPELDNQFQFATFTADPVVKDINSAAFEVLQVGVTHSRVKLRFATTKDPSKVESYMSVNLLIPVSKGTDGSDLSGVYNTGAVLYYRTKANKTIEKCYKGLNCSEEDILPERPLLYLKFTKRVKGGKVQFVTSGRGRIVLRKDGDNYIVKAIIGGYTWGPGRHLNYIDYKGPIVAADLSVE